MKKEIAPKNKTKRVIARIGLSILGILVVLIAVVAIVLNTVVTPKKITPILLGLSSEYIRGEVDCQSIDITFFSTFPDLGVKLQHGSISSGQDTLLAFDNFTVALNPIAFIFDKKIIIKQFELENADIYAHVDTAGRPNWDIFVSTDSIAGQDSTTLLLPELNISNIRLRNVNLTYDDLQQDAFVMIDSLNMRLKGNLSKEQADLSLGIRTSGITAHYQGQTFTRALPFSFNTRLVRNRVQKTLAVERGRIKVSTLELKTSGILKQDTVNKTVDTDIDFSLNASSLSDLAKMIPEHVSEIPAKLVAGGKVESNGKLTGTWGKDLYPSITLSAQLTDGTLASVKHPKKPFLEDLDIDFSSFIDLSGKQPSQIELKNLYMQTASSKLTLKGEFNNILDKPAIRVQALANIDFTQIAGKLPLDGMKMGGQIDLDFSAKCLLDDIRTSNYGKIDAHGVINVKDVRFNYPEEQFTFYTTHANIALGSNVKDSVVSQAPSSLLRSKIVLDTLNLNWKDELIANSSRVSALLTTALPKDTGAIVPISIGGRIKNMRLNMSDSVRIRGVQALGGINIRPRTDIPSLPEISGSLTVDTLMGRAYDVMGRISKASLKLKLTKQQVRQRDLQSARATRDSTRTGGMFTRAQRDSMRQANLDPTANLSFQVESQGVKDLLRNWNISGGMSSKNMSVRTPYFPIPIRIRESEISFTDNTLHLTKAHMHIGTSDFTLKGEAEGLRRALMRNGKISAKMTLEADSLNFNELIRAAVAGSEYGQHDLAVRDSISGAVFDERNTIVLAEDTTAMGIFVVPRNLDIEFNSHIRNGKFSDVDIRSARGRIILRDQAIQLPRLALRTDIGNVTMTMVYKAPNTKGAHLGIELGMKRVDLKELIETMPIMVEMAPMLSSFEGVVDCNMTAITELDSLMNVRLPETTASCYLSGKNLVLLDGETFAEISKTLMFKNKNKNVIDSMSVEMILEDEKLMIFPFQLSMDRYNAAVGGIQNLDMSFDYHITVLKSPIPFKLGLNISGTPDKMKIRLGKAKYKDMFTVARQKDLGATINLRQEMDAKLRKSIEEIAGMELTQRVYRPRTEIPDSLKRHLFQLEDTTATAQPTDPGLVETTTDIAEIMIESADSLGKGADSP